MHLDAAVTEFFYSKDFTPESHRFYQRTLAAFTAWGEKQGFSQVDDITASAVRRYLASLRDRISSRTGQRITGVSQHGYANALRTFLNFCARQEWLDERIPNRMEMPTQEKKVLQVLSAQQIQLLFRATDKAECPEQVRTVLVVVLDTGLRVHELCCLRLEDVHFHGNDAWLKVHGKRRREREVPLGKKTRLALHRYLHAYRDAPETQPHAILGKRGPLTERGQKAPRP